MNTITNAAYIANPKTNENEGISCVFDGKTMCVPLDPSNRHYAEIKAKHDDPNDSFTIQDAD